MSIRYRTKNRRTPSRRKKGVRFVKGVVIIFKDKISPKEIYTSIENILEDKNVDSIETTIRLKCPTKK
jgi:hypothetical protein